MTVRPKSEKPDETATAATAAVNAKNTVSAARKEKQKKKKNKENKKEPHAVVVYYFYTQPRCVSCMNIEKFTAEALKTELAKELKNGTLFWLPVDVKSEGNSHYIDEFQLHSKSVVVADYKGAKPDKDKLLRSKNLEKIWELLKDKPKFIQYIQDETRAYLKEEPKKEEKK